MSIYEKANELLGEYRDQEGVSIEDASYAAPVMLVLLRHIGCSFCRRTLRELSESMKHITECGYRVGLVHMDDERDMMEQLELYGLAQIPRYHDRERKLYRALGLPRMPLKSAFKSGVWQKGIESRRQFGASWPKTDPLQLPGVFVIDQGRVIDGESTLSPEEHPDFLALLIRMEALAG